MIINKQDIEILTPSGFQKFAGVRKSISNKTRKILFDDNTHITCTDNHVFIHNNKEIIADTLKIGDSVFDKTISDIVLSNTEVEVYDAVNVGGGNLYITDGIISHNCTFNGSSKSLISGAKLGSIATHPPIFEKDLLKVHYKPIEGHSYVCTVDTSRGQHLDYSAFVIFDITELPYKVVATYKNNQISPMTYPFLIMRTCQQYNNCHTLVEINDIGGQVADTLFYEYEYENMYFTYKDELNEGMGYPGVRTTKLVKSIGCSILKDLIENEQLEVMSHDILQELSVFVQKGKSYAAENESINDDLTTCLWLFGWLTKQQLFKDLTDTNIRSIIAKKTEDYINDNMVPFGIIDTGIDESNSFGQYELDLRKYSSLDAWVFSDLPSDYD